MPKPKVVIDDLLITFGGAVKSVQVGTGQVSGMLVVHTDPNRPKVDLTGQYFTKSTDHDLDRSDQASIYFNHALDGTIKKIKIGTGTMKIVTGLKLDDGTELDGVWIDGQLNMRNKYARAVNKLAEKGALGWSSGTMPNLVETKIAGKGIEEITKWPLGLDATLTTTPCEPTAFAYSLKSVIDAESIENAHALFEEALKSVEDLDDDENDIDAVGLKSIDDAGSLGTAPEAMTVGSAIIAKVLTQFNTIIDSLAMMGCLTIDECVVLSSPFMTDLLAFRKVIIANGGDAEMADYHVDSLYYKARAAFPETVGAIIPAACLQAFNIAADFALTRAYITIAQRRAIGRGFDKVIDNLTSVLDGELGDRKLSNYRADWVINLKSALTGKSLANSASALLQAKIHQAFTVTADELAIRGYVDVPTRIKMSGAIGDALKKLAIAFKDLASITISADDVDAIACKSFVDSNQESVENGPRLSRTHDMHTKALQAEAIDYADRMEDLTSDRDRPLGTKALANIETIEQTLTETLDRIRAVKSQTPSTQVVDADDAMKTLRDTVAFTELELAIA